MRLLWHSLYGLYADRIEVRDIASECKDPKDTDLAQKIATRLMFRVAPMISMLFSQLNCMGRLNPMYG